MAYRGTGFFPVPAAQGKRAHQPGVYRKEAEDRTLSRDLSLDSNGAVFESSHSPMAVLRATAPLLSWLRIRRLPGGHRAIEDHGSLLLAIVAYPEEPNSTRLSQIS